MMEKRRDVVRLLSIFNLNTKKAPCLPENTLARIMLIYDKVNNVKEFKVLGSGITEDVDSKIRSWLEENIEIEDMIHGLN
jgi:hypothetical protein